MPSAPAPSDDVSKVSEVPKVGLALATGSPNWGLAFPEDIGFDGVRTLQRDMSFETPYGRSDNWKLIEFDASITADGQTKRALCMYSHGNPRDEMDHSCHRRAFWVLMTSGVHQIISCSSVGAVNKAIQPGDLAIAADIIELTQTPYSLLPGRQKFDCSGKQIVCARCAAAVAKAAQTYWPVGRRVHGIEQGLIAGHAYGPRLTTPAEAMAFRTLGADIINHSIAPEATLAREIGACFVPLALVTVGFNDYMDRNPQLLRGNVLSAYSIPLSQIALEAAAKLPARFECTCQSLKSPQPEERYSRF